MKTSNCSRCLCGIRDGSLGDLRLLFQRRSTSDCGRTDMRLEGHFESSSTLQRNERVKLAASFWNNVGAGMVIGGVGGGIFFNKTAWGWGKNRFSKSGIVVGLVFFFNFHKPFALFSTTTQNAAHGHPPSLPTQYSAPVCTGTNNDPAHMKKGHLDEKEEQRIPKAL